MYAIIKTAYFINLLLTLRNSDSTVSLVVKIFL